MIQTGDLKIFVGWFENPCGEYCHHLVFVTFSCLVQSVTNFSSWFKSMCCNHLQLLCETKSEFSRKPKQQDMSLQDNKYE